MLNQDLIFTFKQYDKPKRTAPYLPKRQGQYWHIFEDFALTQRYLSGLSIHEIAKEHERSFKSIYMRLELNNLLKEKLTPQDIFDNNKQYLKRY